jgi:hypothetical protein
LGDSAFGKIAGDIANLGPSMFKLDGGDRRMDEKAGLYDARVQVALSKSQTGSFLTELDSMAIKLQQHTAVLSDAWNASGPGEVSARVQQANAPVDVPAKLAYLPATTMLLIATPVEPTGPQFHLHQFDPDLVPADRLTNPQ